MQNNNKLAEIKELARKEGKEPFDFVKFASIYPHDRGGVNGLNRTSL